GWKLVVAALTALCVTEELCVLESRAHADGAPLLARAEPRLEPHQVPHLAGLVFAPELQHRIRLPTGSWIRQPHRLHRAEPERVVTARRQHLDRQAPLDVRHATGPEAACGARDATACVGRFGTRYCRRLPARLVDHDVLP